MLPLTNPTAPQLTLRRGIVRSFSASAMTVTVALDGAMGAVTLPAGEWILSPLIDDDVVVCLFFDDNNPNDGVVLGGYGSGNGPLTSGEVAYGDSDGLLTSSSNFTFNGSRVALPVTGSSGGLLVGGDVALYRESADLWKTPDGMEISGGIGVGDTPGGRAINTFGAQVKFYVAHSDSDTPGLTLTMDYGGNSGNVYGIQGTAYTSHSSGTISIHQGIIFNAVHQSAGAVSNLIGLQGRTQVTSSGSATIGRALYADMLWSGTGNITDAYLISGIVSKTSSGGPTNLYGLYIPDITIGGTNNYAIYTNAGVHRFGGTVSSLLGFRGATPVAAPDYTVTNPTTDRALNVTGDTLAQGLAVLGTLIADLITLGLLQ